MTHFKRQLIAAAATGLMILNIAAPAFATGVSGGSTDLTISGNGSDSENKIYVDTTSTNSIAQTNNATVTNSISSNSSTGGNTAMDNTGGDVKVLTGDAKSLTTVANMLNSNQASVNCCDTGTGSVKISGNGADSYNKVDLDQINTNSIKQDNNALVTNTVDANAQTGGNTAKDNTGGSVTIGTGDATVGVDVSTKANANFANVGGNGSGTGTGLVDAIISGNGADSTNKIYLDVTKDNTIVQENNATVINTVDANAKTGWNWAKDNTGGDVLILTGDAKSLVGVDNEVNFNWANVDCGCLTDINAKVAGNGTDSYNKIKADLSNDLVVDQGLEKGGNFALLVNGVDSNTKTGWNFAKDNTGPVVGDPTWVLTGDGKSVVDVVNTGNSNVYGGEAPADWPNFMGHGLTITVDLDQLAGLLHITI